MTTDKYFVSQIDEDVNVDAQTIQCKFMRRVTNRNSFHFPQIDDRSPVKRAQILHVLQNYEYRRGYLTIHDKTMAVRLLLNN
jgi:hypothetical protein